MWSDSVASGGAALTRFASAGLGRERDRRTCRGDHPFPHTDAEPAVHLREHAGRFGELMAISGPEVTAASLVDDGDEDATTVPLVVGERRVLQLESDGVEIDDVKRYTTIERMGGYVQLRPNCGSFRIKKDGPYEVAVEAANSAVKHLYQRKDHQRNWIPPTVHDGNCLRISGAVIGPEQGILIHEAPHVGWLTGCISPRTLNIVSTELVSRPRTNESYLAMSELFLFLGREARTSSCSTGEARPRCRSPPGETGGRRSRGGMMSGRVCADI